MWAGNGKHFEVITVRPKTAFRISENRATPKRKSDAQSEFSLNISTTSDNEYSVIGADCTIPELPFEGGYTAIDKCHDNALSRRTRGIQYNLVIFILSRTTSAARRPMFAQITIREYRQRTGDSERNIYLALAALEQQRFIERDLSGGVRACPENFAAAPLPAARTCRKRPKVAEVLAPSPLAALRVTAAPIAPASNQANDRTGERAATISPAAAPSPLKLTAVAAAPVVEPAPVDLPAAAPSPLKLTTVADEADCKKAETYCPWNWTCPHLSTASPLVSIETRNIEEPTTTGASRPAGSLRADAENAYLARFLQPATRVGQFLQFDDAAAGRVWAECSAVNPALTPRTLGIVARMKLAEWRRVDDSRPGRRVRSLTGLLIRSLPNAVVGALYLQACELAPAELDADCREARRILAEPAAAPRDRAWARAVLIERGDET
jgi:hypothetical protein